MPIVGKVEVWSTKDSFFDEPFFVPKVEVIVDQEVGQFFTIDGVPDFVDSWMMFEEMFKLMVEIREYYSPLWDVKAEAKADEPKQEENN